MVGGRDGWLVARQRIQNEVKEKQARNTITNTFPFLGIEYKFLTDQLLLTTISITTANLPSIPHPFPPRENPFGNAGSINVRPFRRDEPELLSDEDRFSRCGKDRCKFRRR